MGPQSQAFFSEMLEGLKESSLRGIAIFEDIYNQSSPYISDLNVLLELANEADAKKAKILLDRSISELVQEVQLQAVNFELNDEFEKLFQFTETTAFLGSLHEASHDLVTVQFNGLHSDWPLRLDPKHFQVGSSCDEYFPKSFSLLSVSYELEKLRQADSRINTYDFDAYFSLIDDFEIIKDILDRDRVFSIECQYKRFAKTRFEAKKDGSIKATIKTRKGFDNGRLPLRREFFTGKSIVQAVRASYLR